MRELRNVITRAVALAPAGAGLDEMPIMLRPMTGDEESSLSVTADRPFHEAKAEVVTRFETGYLTDLLRRADGNLSQAARLAGLERKYLYRLLERTGLREGKKSD